MLTPHSLALVDIQGRWSRSLERYLSTVTAALMQHCLCASARHCLPLLRALIASWYDVSPFGSLEVVALYFTLQPFIADTSIPPTPLNARECVILWVRVHINNTMDEYIGYCRSTVPYRMWDSFHLLADHAEAYGVTAHHF